MPRGGDWIHPPTRYAIVWFRDAGRCLVCGWRPAERFGPGLVLDHVIPASEFRAWGWIDRPHSPHNLATLCKVCHDRRGRLPWWEFYTGAAQSRMLRATWRPLTRWHRRRGYLAAVRTGRYRRDYNVQKCDLGRVDRRYRQEERAAIVEFGGG